MATHRALGTPAQARWASGRVQSPRNPQGGPRGYDGEKKLVGRKRHAVVDTLGLLWALVVMPASVQDRDGGKLALEQFHRRVKFPKVIWADTAHHATARWAGVL